MSDAAAAERTDPAGDDDPLDLALLRAYEPVIRYNEGELFFPVGVDGYLGECDLLQGTSERDRRVVVPRGSVTRDVIATWVAPPGTSLYLRLVQEPLVGIGLARWHRAIATSLPTWDTSEASCLDPDGNRIGRRGWRSD